jgi:hypothetical protein
MRYGPMRAGWAGHGGAGGATGCGAPPEVFVGSSGGMRSIPRATASAYAVPATSFRNRGLLRSESNVGSIRSQPGEM